MANDKIKDLTPTDVDFRDGESPTSTKLDGMMQQVHDGIEYLSYAVGDIGGFSGIAMIFLILAYFNMKTREYDQQEAHTKIRSTKYLEN